MTPQAPPKKKSWSWRSQAFRGLIYQIIAIGAVGLGVWWLASNTMHNMQVRGIQSGFDFLKGPAGFDIGESLYEFDSSQPYWQAFLVGLTNTLRVAIVGIVLTTILGTLLGVGRFSRNALVRGLCYAYVEFFRNVPVLLQLLMWYLMFTEVLPAAQEAWTLGPLFLSKGGLSFPVPIWATGHLWALIGMIAGIAVAVIYRRWAFRQFEASGKLGSMFWIPLGIVVLLGVAGWLAGGAPAEFNSPTKGDFSIENGGSLTPEFLSVLIVLTVYTAAFVAEVVRAGIQSVARGQGEAAAALGLNQSHTMQLVDALIKANKDFDLLLLPGRHHSLVSQTDTYFLRRRWDYFVRHLAGVEPPKEFTFQSATAP